MSRPLLGLIVGGGVGLGAFIVAAALAGQLPPLGTIGRSKVTAAGSQQRADRVVLRVGLGITLAVFALLATGWIAATIGFGVFGWWAPSIVGVRARRRRENERAEAVATWCEMLRDTLAAADGLREAIAATARVAPDAIADEVRALDLRAQRGELADALRRFAEELGDPVADTVVVALLAATQRQGRNLGEMLSAVAGSVRQTTGMQLRMSAARTRTFRSAQLICGISVSFIALVVLWNREYFAPFDTPVGQLVLLAGLGLAAMAGWGLLALSKPVRAPRLLADAAAVGIVSGSMSSASGGRR